jgi:hypothetical protein
MEYDFYSKGVPSLTNLLDESLLDMLDTIINPMEEYMFNPVAVQGQTFTVEIIKQDGTLGTLTGQLVAPNYEGSKEELFAYTVDLLNQDRVPVYTDKGWRSFYQTKVVSFKFGV